MAELDEQTKEALWSQFGLDNEFPGEEFKRTHVGSFLLIKLKEQQDANIEASDARMATSQLGDEEKQIIYRKNTTATRVATLIKKVSHSVYSATMLAQIDPDKVSPLETAAQLETEVWNNLKNVPGFHTSEHLRAMFEAAADIIPIIRKDLGIPDEGETRAA